MASAGATPVPEDEDLEREPPQATVGVSSERESRSFPRDGVGGRGGRLVLPPPGAGGPSQ